MNKKVRILTVLLALTALLGIGAPGQAQVIGRFPLAAVSPDNNAFGMPLWYEDQSGRRIELCLDPPTLAPITQIVVQDPCLLDGLPTFDPTQPMFLPLPGDLTPANFPDESFYFMGDTSILNAGPNGNLTITLGENLEVAFLGPLFQGFHIIFSRIQVDPGTNNGPNTQKLTPLSTYTFIFPMGRIVGTTDAVGHLARIREEFGCGGPPCNPNDVIAPFDFPFRPNENIIGPDFLPAVGFPAPIPGYTGLFLGDPFVGAQAITPGVNGNFFRVEGPNVGGIGIDFVETFGFTIMGKQFSPPLPPAVRDFNGDSRDDILWHHGTTGAVAVWLMNGTAFTAAAPVATVDPATGWQIVGIGDFNGDANADILWRNTTTGTVAVWFMTGTTFTAAAPIAIVDPATGWTVAGVGDFNADANPDILWRNTTTGDVSVWQMTGTTFSSGASIATVDPASGWTVAGVGDFSVPGDGNPDILWRNATTGDLSVWLMAGPAVSSGVSVATVAPATGWETTGLGDFSVPADGNPDILWRNTTTGDVAAWLMNGTAFGSGVTLGTVADLQWRIRN